MNLLLVAEVSVFVLVDFVPNLLLAIIPFREYLRFSKQVTAIMLVSIYIMIVASRILSLSSLKAATVFTVLWIVIYLIFYRINFSMELTKLLFVLLVILNYGSFIAIIYTYFAYHALSGITDRPYSFRTSAVLTVVLLLSYPAIAFLMEKKIKPLIASGINNRIWKYLWMVPGTFCLSYYYNLYANGGIMEFSKIPANVLFAAIFNLGSLFVTYIISRLVKDSNDALILKGENYKLSLQSIQFENLQNRIEETRRAKHDLRQILTVIQSYLQSDDTKRLKEYVAQYTNFLPPDTKIIYCEDYALNALLIYYADLAEKHQIPLQISACYPSTVNITDSDAVILLGNLLENALEACLRQTDNDRFITLNIQTMETSIVITLDNSFNGAVNLSGNHFISSKRERVGVGISSVQNIANKYEGIAKFEYTERVFSSSVLLYPDFKE